MEPTIEIALKKGVEAHKAGELQEANRLYSEVLKVQPEHPDANNNLAVLAVGAGKFQEALPLFKKALETKPNVAQYWLSYITVLIELGKFDTAEEAYNQAKKIGSKGREFELLAQKILARTRIKSERTNQKEHDSDYVKRNILDTQALDKAVKLAKQKSNDSTADKITRLPSDKLIKKPLNDKTLSDIESLIQSEPDLPEDPSQDQLQLLAKLYNQGQLQQVLSLAGHMLQQFSNSVILYNILGAIHAELGNPEVAIKNYNHALKIKPDFADAHNNIGAAFIHMDNSEAAISSYRKALKIKPEHTAARISKLYQQLCICDWSDLEQEQNLIPSLGTAADWVEPLAALSLEDSPERHRLRSELYAKQKYKQEPTAFDARPNTKPGRLRIGYFSADCQEHPVAYLMAKVFEVHDRERFETYGYSIAPAKDDDMRRRLTKAFDFFKDVQHLNDQEIAILARQDKIDIAIDLTGYTRSGRSGVFANRAAPVQINYLGYPGTMGADFIDYIIADKNLIPLKSQIFYSEKPIYLPHQYQAQDDDLSISQELPSRSTLGLPESGFVFCAINSPNKIRASEFDIWMRLLQRVSGSVLWLLESNRWIKGNLLKEAAARGINSERLIFTPKRPHGEYLAQFQQADLYLDTFIYNAGATASNALWAGLPVLTKLGNGYTARMAGSLLNSIGLPELITSTETEYEELAFKLATEPARLANIRQTLMSNRRLSPLFKTELFTRHLEDGYKQAYQQYFDGKDPAAIFVS